MRDILSCGSVVVLDGAMGTQLQARGLQPGEVPELWNLSRSDDVRAIHDAYLAAGADVVYTNTFGANRAKYHGDAPLAEVVKAGVGIARAAADAAHGRRFVALDVGPTGRLLKPSGDFEFDAAYDAFAEQVRAGADADLVVVETMSDAYELKAAVLAAKENSALPILATVALGEDGKLLTGADVECVAALLEGLHVDAVGFNCGFGPEKMLPFVRRLASCTSLPVVVKPNAGMPHMEGGRTVFDLDPECFARDVAELVKAGATLIGGCCGTTPAHIAALSASLRCAQVGTRVESHEKTVVTSGSRAVEIPLDDSIVVGERINPTGKKRLKAALSEGDTAYILREAVSQTEAGAHVLDVNVGVPGLDEPATLDWAVQAVQSVTDLPLQLDSSDPKALERAMRHYNGKPLVNSVNGKEDTLSAILPLVAKYGGVVVALTLDENGIPPTSDGRLEIARKILSRGKDFGLRPCDFLVDVLCLAVSAEPQSANVILESMRRVRDELGCRTCLGVSNISFGLPARQSINAAFYTLALGAGLSAGIVNPLSAEMMTAYRAYRALTARDAQCSCWIEFAPDIPAAAGQASVSGQARRDSSQQPDLNPLSSAIRRGLKDDAATAAKAMISSGAAAISVVNDGIIPALEVVGQAFESGKAFLPQLLMSADAAGAAFEVVRAAFPIREGSEKGPVVMATVKGDIHDIGKNICRALLENYGFRVIDLGRDVPPERILEAARREKARLVGLSALMTTTVGAMEETVSLVHRELTECSVVVGGAVLTADYAAKIGADYYTKDAMSLVRLAESLFAEKTK